MALSAAMPTRSTSSTTPHRRSSCRPSLARNNGWYTSDVTVSWSVTDPETAITSSADCNDVTLTTDDAGASFTCTATSTGGTSTQTVTVMRDATAPTISAATTTAPNAAGWYNTDVAVAYTCDDALSGVTACPATQTLSTEGNAVSSSAQVITDQAGNSSAVSNVVTVSIDKTAPTLAPTVSPNPLLLHAITSATANGSDALSGIASSSCVALNTMSVGIKSTTCTVTDVAGNSASAAAGYRVIYGFSFGPLSQVPAQLSRALVKHSIRFDWKAVDINGVGIDGLTPVMSVVELACTPAQQQQATQMRAYGSSNPALQQVGYGQYRQDFAISAMYSNQCKTLQLDLGDDIKHNAGGFYFTSMHGGGIKQRLSQKPSSEGFWFGGYGPHKSAMRGSG